MEMEIKVANAYKVDGGIDTVEVLEPKKGSDKEFDREKIRENQYVDAICIFISPNKPGIMFFDRTLNFVENKDEIFVYQLKGKYITDMSSISSAIWDPEVNAPNASRELPYKYGVVKVKTIMVTSEKFLEIINDIFKSQTPGRLVINVGHGYLSKIDNTNSFKFNKDNNYNENIVKKYIDFREEMKFNEKTKIEFPEFEFYNNPSKFSEKYSNFTTHSYYDDFNDNNNEFKPDEGGMGAR